jgi:hypothetical protein
MLPAVPPTDVLLNYTFFVGATPNLLKEPITSYQLAQESSKYGDITILDKVVDIPERLSEKRYSAFKWVSFSYGLNFVETELIPFAFFV